MPTIYKHTMSGRLYEIVTTAKHTENDEELVIYKDFVKTDNDICRTWARPANIFYGYVNKEGELVPRFTKVDGLHDIFTDDELEAMMNYLETERVYDNAVKRNAKSFLHID